MSFAEYSLDNFTTELASSSPVPGGGGAAGLIGSLAASLGSMAASLSVGKKKTDEEKQCIDVLRSECALLREELLYSIDYDAECFLPLSKAYSIPKDAPERSSVIRRETLNAAGAPYKTLKLCCRVAELLEFLLPLCSRLLISDVACAASCCRAAIDCCLINILVNTSSLKDDSAAAALGAEALELAESASARMDSLYSEIKQRML